jgi:hypothetical protein
MQDDPLIDIQRRVTVEEDERPPMDKYQTMEFEAKIMTVAIFVFLLLCVLLGLCI